MHESNFIHYQVGASLLKILIQSAPTKHPCKRFNILKLEQEQFIQEQVKSRKYDTDDEVIFEAFRLLEERDKHYEKWVEETREKVA